MKRTVLLLTAGAVIAACGMQHKISDLRNNPVSADLALPEEPALPSVHIPVMSEKDTTEIREPGDMLIMNAVKDENGEMTATDVIRASTVTARFRNIAERHGKVDLKFQIRVPKELRDGRWQLKLTPDMFILGDSTRLETIVITGEDYRRRQMKGYELYQKFLNSIVSDPEKFIDRHQLEVFIKRNLPVLYSFRNDTTFVSDEEFASAYGITEQAAIEHYTNNFRINMNERKKDRKDKMYRKYVKAPIEKDGIRLDTVLLSPEGDFIYDYTQTVNTRPGLKKAEIKLSGTILENGESILNIPASQPLAFYISSLSSFTDLEERYITKIIPRKVSANTACYIDFTSAGYDIDLTLGNNRTETARIRKNLTALASDKEFEMDSIVVTASCSPEGKVKYNQTLSEKRAASISGYFGNLLKEIRDSIRMEGGIHMDLSGKQAAVSEPAEVRFISRTSGENWKMLDTMIERDTLLSARDRKAYYDMRAIPDPDIREEGLSRQPCYKYLREKLYPKLRTVKFDFFLHRKVNNENNRNPQKTPPFIYYHHKAIYQ